MNEDQVREAIDSLPNNPRRAKSLLQAAIDEEPEYDIMGGHIIDSNGRCQAMGCELAAPHLHCNRDVDKRVGMEWLEEVVEKVECPANIESIEGKRPVYMECPNCGEDPGFLNHCPECGMPVN